MGLIKKNDNTYWVIGEIIELKNITRLKVYCYIDKQYRIENIENFLSEYSYDIDGVNYTINQLYQKVKEKF